MAIEETFGLSPVQLGMLYHHIAGNHPGTDHEQLLIAFAEEVDPVRLELAWADAQRRHPMLRTAFRWLDVAEARQVTHTEAEIQIELADWQSLDGAAQESNLNTLLREDRATGFDLGSSPLMRFILIQRGKNEYTLLWSFPHILLDGWSWRKLLSEVFTTYDTLAIGDAPTHPIPRPFSDHIAWLDKQDPQKEREFWQEMLQCVEEPTRLPGTHSSSSALDFQDASTQLEPELTLKLKELARESEVSLNNVVQGALALVLQRWSGADDVVFGATRSGRRQGLKEASDMVGLFINTLPVVARFGKDQPVAAWLKSLGDDQYRIREHEHTPLVDVTRWSGVPAGQSLFEALLIFDNDSLEAPIPGPIAPRNLTLIERTTYPLTLHAYGGESLELKLSYDPATYPDQFGDRFLAQLRAGLEDIAARPDALLSAINVLPARERALLLDELNDTARAYHQDECIQHLFEAQVRKTPDAIALTYRETTLTYRELDGRASELAGHLLSLGVQGNDLVGICTDRSTEMVIAVLAVLKVGAGYLPLDPTYPRDRLRFIIDDSGVQVVLTQSPFNDLAPEGVKTVLLDRRHSARAEAQLPAGSSSDLAYAIYTSGSTGKPKGVLIEHRNVVNFFAAMDDLIDHDPPGVWLAVTSLSFDISVLELLWTLCRGFKVVLYDGGLVPSKAADAGAERKPLDFSLSYFGAGGAQDSRERYRLILDGARFADENNWTAVWTPERHFHEFGGLFPNPAVLSAAIATTTKNLRIRAGSAVLPLHSPITVAEEWSLVDNLSNGRVDVSFAPGWQPNDFVLKPENFKIAKQVMLRDLATVRRLWRGEEVEFPGHDEKPISIRILPRPVQAELPVWLTAAGSAETFRVAGELGTNILTHLLGQSAEEVAEKIRIYRDAWHLAGHEGEGHVTLMLHSFVGDDDKAVRDLVREPMIKYLASSVSLIRNYSWAFPTFQQRAGEIDILAGDGIDSLAPDELRSLLEYAFDRYYETSGLFGTTERCLRLLEDLWSIGVDEIACLVDFGLDAQAEMEGLRSLHALKMAYEHPSGARTLASVPELIEAQDVTHMQCTPSFANMLLLMENGPRAIQHLKHLMVGGEALPPTLAQSLTQLSLKVTNMYGPTETTIWSCTHEIRRDAPVVPIGRPIANTQVYILDSDLRPVPLGATGDLYIGGAGVARGYLERDELTAERFLPNPFVDAEGARIYKTGDVAHYLPNGDIEFLGRADFQVKIRGHRIELGEIETWLLQHEEIREAVVIARAVKEGEQELVAYLIGTGGPLPNVAALRSHVLSSLPDYMVPSQFVWLETFPLTPNGKIDRKSLPSPAFAQPPLQDFAGPESDLERLVAEIWGEVLGISSVSVEKNFFDMGGHSLHALRIHRRLVERVDHDVKLTDIFGYPTVRTMTGFIASKGSGKQAADRGVDRAEKRRQAASVRAGRFGR